jgi:RNA polymerase sigma-70 factor (ECF subfamily)
MSRGDDATTASSDRNERLSALLARVAMADQRAFEEVYRLTAAHLYAVVLRIVKDRSIAEEILQEAYVNVWQPAGTYDAARAQPSTWLTSIVRNRALDLKRRREIDTIAFDSGEDGTPDMDYPSDGPTPVEMLMSAADERSIHDCVETLEGGAKQAIALAFFHGLSHGELAAHLREPLGTVKSWIRRGLEKLRRCLDAAGAAE